MKKVTNTVEKSEQNSQNPILERVLADVHRATEGEPAEAAGHSSYVSGVFEPEGSK